MNPGQKAQLEAEGYYDTTVAEWLGLTQAESDDIEIRRALARMLQCVRERAGLSMRTAARRLGMTEAEYRQLERGVVANEIERRIVAALTFGARYHEIGRAIAEWPGDTSLQRPDGFPDEDDRRSPPSAPSARRETAANRAAARLDERAAA
jgi:transcriptional regulator with XRE-family HTH domain